jgi:hypothetical protein
MLGVMGSNAQISRAGLHCISEDSFYKIPSPLGLHFSSTGVLKLSISAMLAWAKIAMHASFACLDEGWQTFLLMCLKLQCIKVISCMKKAYGKSRKENEFVVAEVVAVTLTTLEDDPVRNRCRKIIYFI